MVKSKKALALLSDMSNYLLSDGAREDGRTKSTAFTRDRKLSFTTIAGMILNSLTKSLQIELEDFFEYVLGEDQQVTKQAFSKARQNIRPDFFKRLAQMTVRGFYMYNDYRTYQGYRLLAIDGMTLDLPDFCNLRECFGHVGNKNKTVRAAASGLFDIENGIIIAAEIDNYRIDERSLARRHLAELKEYGYHRDLLLYDRGYPSKEWLAYHLGEGLDFVMRAKDAFLYRKFVYRGEVDIQQAFTWKGKEYTIRRVVFELESGERETLLTSLPESFRIEDLKAIYAKRWGIESEYYYLKHRLQIENFSGYSISAVLQDFHASVCINNIAATFIGDVELDRKPDSKHTYKANKNIMLGKLKHRMIKAILSGGGALLRFFSMMCEVVERNVIPIRPGRSFPRVEGWKRLKYPPNMRGAI